MIRLASLLTRLFLMTIAIGVSTTDFARTMLLNGHLTAQLSLGGVLGAPAAFSSGSVMAAALVVAGFGTMLVAPRLAVWLLGTIGLGMQTPEILAHDGLNWGTFLSGTPFFEPSLSSAVAAAHLVVFLGAFLLWHSATEISFQIQSFGRRGVSRKQLVLIFTGGLSASTLLCITAGAITGIVVTAASALSIVPVFNVLPWRMLTIGLLVCLLTAGIIALWMRVLNERLAPPSPPSRADARNTAVNATQRSQ